MKHSHNLYFFISFVSISISHAASSVPPTQLNVEPQRNYEIQTARDQAYSNYPDSARFNLGEFSTEEENEIKELSKKTRPLYSGIGRELSLSGYNWVRVKQDGGFDVWQVHIHSPYAVNLKVHFTDFNLTNGMSVNVYSYDKSDTYIKEYSGKGWTGDGEFWSQQVVGDVIIVEFWSPTSKGLSFSNFPFSIDKISHTFRDKDGAVRGVSLPKTAIPQSHGACPFRKNDVCNYSDPAIVTARLSVARFTVTNRMTGRQTGGCTGNLIDNSKKDGTLYFLTAWHCIDAAILSPQSPKGTDIDADFEFKAAACLDSARGQNASFIAGHIIGDYALLRIKGRLTSQSGGPVNLLPWSSSPLNTNDRVFELHHAAENIGTAQQQQTDQNYARGTIQNLAHIVGVGVDDFDVARPCQGSGCSHYDVHYSPGSSSDQGASGASLMVIRNNTPFIVGVHSYGSSPACRGGFSRFSKIYEDGRVVGALTHGADYCSTNNCISTGTAANFNDSKPPTYRLTRPSSGGGGGGGGAIELWFLLLLLPLLLLARLTRE